MKLRKLMALTMAGVMALSLAACGGRRRDRGDRGRRSCNRG